MVGVALADKVDIGCILLLAKQIRASAALCRLETLHRYPALCCEPRTVEALEIRVCCAVLVRIVNAPACGLLPLAKWIQKGVRLAQWRPTIMSDNAYRDARHDR
jgi:hypothetical protein